MPDVRAAAYVNAIVEREAHDVAAATQGTRHHTLRGAARTLGRLVGGGEFDEATASYVLRAAAAAHVGVAGTTLREITPDHRRWPRVRPQARGDRGKDLGPHTVERTLGAAGGSARNGVRRASDE